MPAAGFGPPPATTWLALASEWQPDHAPTEHIEEFVQVLKEHEPGSGITFLWEQPLLYTDVEKLEISAFDAIG